jgi:hypothetical protein
MGGGHYSGRALLSWRVALLPYLGETALYRQFRLNEPWDSPHNKKLLAKMPAVYAPPGTKTREPYMTFYQVFVGPHAGFEKHRALHVANFTDGTSNTILIAEAGSPVPWTKPEDLRYAEDEPLPELGGLFPGLFHVAMADGSVLALRKGGDSSQLRRAITRDDGHVVDFDALRTPMSQAEADLQRENERLRDQLRKERQRLEALRHEQALLREQADDPGVRRLRQENERLQQQLRQSRQEAERLQVEIRRMRQQRDKDRE